MSSQEYERKAAPEGGPAGGTGFLQPNGASGTDLSRQISVTLTPQQFEGEHNRRRLIGVKTATDSIRNLIWPVNRALLATLAEITSAGRIDQSAG